MNRLLFLFLAVVLAGCTTVSSGDQIDGMQGEWFLVSGRSGDVDFPSSEGEFWRIEVDGDQLSSFGFCNEYEATIRVSDGRFEATDAFRTAMGCADADADSLEFVFFSAIDSSVEVQFRDGALVLVGEQSELVFTSDRPRPPAADVPKVLVVAEENGLAPLGAAGCEPASTVVGNEALATSDSLTAWVLLFNDTNPLSIHAPGVLKMVWSPGGIGEFSGQLVSPTGARTELVDASGPAQATWERVLPGLEWEFNVEFDVPGCWQVHVMQGDDTADLWLSVGVEGGRVLNYRGMTLDEATARLEEAGLVGSVPPFDSQDPNSMVIAQDTRRGEMLASGSVVELRTVTTFELSCDDRVGGPDISSNAYVGSAHTIWPVTFSPLLLGSDNRPQSEFEPDSEGRLFAYTLITQVRQTDGPLWVVLWSDAAGNDPTLLFDTSRFRSDGRYLLSDGAQAVRIPNCDGVAPFSTTGYHQFVGGILMDRPQCVKIRIFNEDLRSGDRRIVGFGTTCPAPDPVAGFDVEVDVPLGWYRAPDTLTPNLSSPVEVLSVGTYQLRGGGSVCAHLPENALRDIGAEDALVSLQVRRTGSGGTPWPSTWSTEVLPPTDEMNDAKGCAEQPDLDVRWKEFSYDGTSIYVLVAFGDDVSEETTAAVWAMLDSFALHDASR